MSITHCVGLTAMAVIWMGAKPAGYLARIGPAPLRFQAPSRAQEALVALPPLAMSDPPPAPEEIYGPPPPMEGVVTEAVVEPAPVATPVFQAPQEGATLSPQMLIQFFNRDGTNQDFTVVAPYQFNPPPATTIPAPPSRATYTKK
jgi:hypothetical protein